MVKGDGKRGRVGARRGAGGEGSRPQAERGSRDSKRLEANKHKFTSLVGTRRPILCRV